MTSATVRPFEQTDAEAVVSILSAIAPDRRLTTEEWRSREAHLDETRYLRRRYVATSGDAGDVIGYATIQHAPWEFHPQKFWIAIGVHPTARRQGVGARLVHHLLDDAQNLGATLVRTRTREDQTDDCVE